MAIKWGNSVVTAVKWGSTNISKVYWGSTLVFPESNLLNAGLTWSPLLNIYLRGTATYGFKNSTTVENSLVFTQTNKPQNVVAVARTIQPINSSVFNRLSVKCNWTYVRSDGTAINNTSANVTLTIEYVTLWHDLNQNSIQYGSSGDTYFNSQWVSNTGETYLKANLIDTRSSVSSAARSGSYEFTSVLADGSWYYYIAVYNAGQGATGQEYILTLTFTELKLSKV